jgi:putative PEP-CTERM system histidine kinase
MYEQTAMFGAAVYGVAAVAYFVLAVLLAFAWKGRLQSALLILACLATCLWTAAAAWSLWANWHAAAATQILVLLELLRNIGWIGVVWSMLARYSAVDTGVWQPRFVLPGGAVGYLVLAGIILLSGTGATDEPPKSVFIIGLTLAIAGVVLTATLYRNGSDDERWHNKFLCLAIGGIFAFDMFTYADAILVSRIDPPLQQAKGAVQLLVVPLLAVAFRRNKQWQSNLSLSRDIVLHSTTFIFVGVYLFLMAVAGFYLRGLGEAWGTVAQVTFFFGAIVLLAVVLFSGTSRAYMKVFFSKHFFEDRYDYREEWHRFIQTLSEGLATATLEERAILAAADIVESPGGAIWLRDGDRYVPAGSRNFAIDDFAEPADGSLARFLGASRWVVEIEEATADPAAYPDLALPAALRHARRAWIIIPLWHHALVGFIVLAQPRAPRRLVWEDFDLLKTVGRQIASYMAEQRAERALTEAREFEEFNRRYAFVIHDIKNIVSQLSVLAANFHKHSNNPAFLQDMIDTIDEAVGKMNRITDKINERQHSPAGIPTVALLPMMERVVATKAQTGANLVPDLGDTEPLVAGDEDRLEAVIGHLVQNAIEATETKGTIIISLRSVENQAVIEITDDGPGMTVDFVRKELFKPFRSTKGRGFGIGAYQCRAYAQELGGRLEVDSTPGKGTTMRMLLPIAKPSSADQSRLAVSEISS